MKNLILIILCAMLFSCGENKKKQDMPAVASGEIVNIKLDEITSDDFVPENIQEKDLSGKWVIKVNSSLNWWQSHLALDRRGDYIYFSPNETQEWHSSGKGFYFTGSREMASNVYVQPGKPKMCMLVKIIDGNYEKILAGSEIRGFEHKIRSNSLYIRVITNDETNPRNRRGGFNDNNGLIPLTLFFY